MCQTTPPNHYHTLLTDLLVVLLDNIHLLLPYHAYMAAGQKLKKEEYILAEDSSDPLRSLDFVVFFSEEKSNLDERLGTYLK